MLRNSLSGKKSAPGSIADAIIAKTLKCHYFSPIPSILKMELLIYVYLQLQGSGSRLGTPNGAVKIGPTA